MLSSQCYCMWFVTRCYIMRLRLMAALNNFQQARIKFEKCFVYASPRWVTLFLLSIAKGYPGHSHCRLCSVVFGFPSYTAYCEHTTSAKVPSFWNFLYNFLNLNMDIARLRCERNSQFNFLYTTENIIYFEVRLQWKLVVIGVSIYRSTS